MPPPASPPALVRSTSTHATTMDANGWTPTSSTASSRECATRAEYRSGSPPGPGSSPDLERRLRLVAAWRAPEYASVNVSEPGASEVMQALLPLYDPGGEPTAGNEALVRAARALGAGAE